MTSQPPACPESTDQRVSGVRLPVREGGVSASETPSFLMRSSATAKSYRPCPQRPGLHLHRFFLDLHFQAWGRGGRRRGPSLSVTFHSKTCAVRAA